MGIPSEMKGIYSQRRLVEKGDKPEECKESSRGIWEGRKKKKRQTKENAKKIHGKFAI